MSLRFVATPSREATTSRVRGECMGHPDPRYRQESGVDFLRPAGHVTEASGACPFAYWPIKAVHTHDY